MKTTILTAALLAAFAMSGGAAQAAQGPPQYDFCPLATCSSGLGLDVTPVKKALPKAARATLCVERRCRTFKVKGGTRILVKAKGLRPGKRAEVELTVRDAGGEVLYDGSVKARVAKLKPNGKGCPPTCFVVKARFDRGKGRLVSG